MNNRLELPFSERILRRFWSKVEQQTEGTACCVWTGSKHEQGYGLFFVSAVEGTQLAHRVAWKIAYGKYPASGLLVRHAVCHNPPCVRWDHLLSGTHFENARDTSEAGRWGNAILTEDAVREIRSLATQGVLHRELAAQFAISRSAVGAVIQRTAWKHVV